MKTPVLFTCTPVERKPEPPMQHRTLTVDAQTLACALQPGPMGRNTILSIAGALRARGARGRFVLTSGSHLGPTVEVV